jgi:hypothetical protein
LLIIIIFFSFVGSEQKRTASSWTKSKLRTHAPTEEMMEFFTGKKIYIYISLFLYLSFVFCSIDARADLEYGIDYSAEAKGCNIHIALHVSDFL